eukprot:gb/GFBE01046611.1/.p1 GENE.gb/GFBE01046611.1/~~gb/GFBE01046611.1/.p1  ORF type:complete len:315 (+),score=72.50 gb/GFBE01046611.1/:1-945(+)
MSRWCNPSDSAKLASETETGKKLGKRLASDENFLHKLDDLMSKKWTGQKGEIYELSPLPSKNREGKSWKCTRWSKDGLMKRFPLWFDEATSRVWWGCWSYSFDPLQAIRTGSISWCKTYGGEVSFVWKPAPAPKSKTNHADAEKQKSWPGEGTILQMRRSRGQEKEQEKERLEVAVTGNCLQRAEKDQDNFTAFFLPETGLQELPKDFKPPPGLAAAPDLQLFTLSELKPATLNIKDQACQAADDDTSAGSSASANGDSEAELSEAEHTSKAPATYEADPQSPRTVEKSTPDDDEPLVFTGITFARVWKPQLRR